MPPARRFIACSVSLRIVSAPAVLSFTLLLGMGLGRSMARSCRRISRGRRALSGCGWRLAGARSVAGGRG